MIRIVVSAGEIQVPIFRHGVRERERDLEQLRAGLATGLGAGAAVKGEDPPFSSLFRRLLPTCRSLRVPSLRGRGEEGGHSLRAEEVAAVWLVPLRRSPADLDAGFPRAGAAAQRAQEPSSYRQRRRRWAPRNLGADLRLPGDLLHRGRVPAVIVHGAMLRAVDGAAEVLLRAEHIELIVLLGRGAPGGAEVGGK